MQYISLLALVLNLLLPSVSHAAETPTPSCSRPLTLALHDHGLLYSSDTGTGIDKDIADEMARRSGCKITVSVLPRARIWQLIESGALDFSLSGITNAERERFAAFAWYVSNKYYLLVRKDAGLAKLADFEKSKTLQLGVIRSFRYSNSANEVVDRISADGRVVQSSGLAPLYQLLLANKIQAMIIEPFDYPVVEATSIRDVTEILEFGDPPVPHGLIMSKTSLPAAEIVKWRALVESMRTDGTMLRIFGKYFKPELAKSMVNF